MRPNAWSFSSARFQAERLEGELKLREVNATARFFSAYREAGAQVFTAYREAGNKRQFVRMAPCVNSSQSQIKREQFADI